MNKEEAKQKFKADEIQIHFDDERKLELLREVVAQNVNGTLEYYKINNCNDSPFSNLPIIKISEITEDIEELDSSDYEYWMGEKWYPYAGSAVTKIRKCQQPTYSKEIAELQELAKKDGYIINFKIEKI